MRAQSPPLTYRPVAEAMEPRLLYAADFAPAAFMAAASSATDASHQRLIETSTGTTTAVQGAEIVFVDTRVPDQAALLADLAAQAKQGRAIEVVLIGADEDGLDRITQTLSARHGVSAVHLISHGQSGAVALGSTVLDEQALLTRAQDVASWGQALTSDADLLIYGCNVGAQANGLALVSGLAALTGADVAASDDPTGATLQGGDWLLEVQSGRIDTQLAPSAQAQTLFAGVLALPPGKGQAVWATSGSNVPQLSVWDGVSSGPAVGTSTMGQWTVVTSAQAPARNETIVVGVDSTGTVKGEVIKGTTSTQIPLTLGSGLPTNRQGFGVAYEQQSGDAMLVWNDGTHLRYSVYNGSSWTAAATVAGYAGAAPQHMQLVSQPGGDGMALVISDANAQDHALIWDGSSWGHATTLGGTAASQTAIAVAYEAQSGHALVAYSQAANANVFYSVFDGTAWSAGTQAGNYLEAATPQHLTLASDPTSNRIALGMISKSATQTFTSFSVWNNGGSQTWGNRTTPAVRTTSTDAPTVAVGYESKSGDLLAVYGTGANTVSYQTLTATGVWSTVQTGPNVGGTPGAIRLSQDPVSNSLMMGAQTTSGRLSFSNWSGTAWSTPVVATNNTGSTTTAAFSWVYQGNIAGNTANTLWLGASQSSSTGWTGTNSITGTEVLAFQDPNLVYGGNTSGTFSHVFDAAAFGASAMNDIDWVSRDVVLSSSITAHRGDVLFSVPSTTTLSSVNSVSANKNDVIMFTPTVAGDYSSGTFTKVFTVNNSLLGLLGLGTASIRGLTLVEQATTVGYTTTLAAGTFLFTYGDGNTAAADILRYSIGDLAINTLITGADLYIDKSITGLEIVSNTVPTSNMTLHAGALLVTFAQDDNTVGTNRISTAVNDIVALSAYTTTTNNGQAYASAEVVFQGADVGMASSTYIDGLALTLDAAPIIDTNGAGSTASINVSENTTAVTTVSAHDNDLYGDLTYQIVGGADAARFTIDSRTGVLRFVSAPDFEKPQDFNDKGNSYLVTVAASDGTYQDTQALTVNVRNVNETPVIVSGGGGNTASLIVADQTTTVTTVHASDQDAGDILVYTIVGGTDQALFQIDSATGALSFNALADFYNPQDADSDNVYQVKVKVSDAAATWDEQTLNITVRPSNLPPAITSDGAGATATIMVNEFHTAVTTVQANDPEAAQITYAISGGADGGRFSIDALTGALSFISPPDTTAPEDTGGVNSYVVEVSASDGPLTTYQTLTVNIQPYTRPVNNVPSSLNATEDTPAALSGLSVADPDAGSSPITVTFGVQHGILSVRDDVASGLGSAGIQYSGDLRTVTLTGSVSAINATLADAAGLTYLADGDYAGPDDLTMVTIDSVNTGTAPPLTASSLITINVAAANDAPTASIAQSAYAATEQTDLALHNTGLHITDVDAATSGVQVTLSSGGGLLTVTAGTTGVTVTHSGTHSVTLAGTVDQINALLDGLQAGSIVYHHPSDTPAAIDTLILTVDDLGHSGAGGAFTHTATVDINITAVNDTPVVTNDSATISEDAVLSGSTVLANDSDVDSTALSATLVSGTSHGTLVFNGDGTYTYTPDADFNGTDTFSYTATDGTSTSSAATVTLTVNAVNDAPVTVNDSATVNEDAVLTGSTVLANDSDTEGTALSAALVSGTSHGTLVFNGDGTYTYTPDADFNGTDTFSYTATDGTSTSSAATVTLTVNAVNDAPVAVNDSATVNEDAVLTSSTVLANDSDTEGTALSAALVSDTSHGTLVFNSDGTYTYTPDADFNGTDTFSYTATDGTSTSSTATVTLTINAVNDAPTVTANALSVNQGGTAEPQLSVSDIDNAATDLVISVSGLAGGHFASSAGSTVTHFTLAELQAHQIIFVHDGSAQVPTYIVSASDGTAVSSGLAVQASFTPTPVTIAPVVAPSAPPAEPPAPPKPAAEADSDKDKEAEAPAAVAASSAAVGSAEVATIAPLSFFIDITNVAPTNAGFTMAPPVNRYGVDMAPRLFNTTAAAAAGEDSFRYGWLKALATTAADAQNLRSSLDALREQLQNEGTEHKHLVASSIAVSTGLSVGYVIWLVRGGALIGSMLSAMPAWQMIDPLPVLSRGRGGNQDEVGDDDASVEHIFDDDGDGRVPPPRPAPPPPPTPISGPNEVAP